MRLRQTAPANLDAFFTNLRTIWLETRGRNIEQAIIPSQNQFTPLPQKDNFKARLARDLSYAGIEMDDATLEKFIYDELKRRLGGTSAHVRKNPFTELPVRNTNATKKAVRKVIQKTPIKRIVT